LGKYGGAERFAWNLAEYLAGFPEYDLHFICARQEAEAPAGVRVHNVKRRGLCRSGKILWFAFAAERERKKGNFDVAISMGKTWKQDILRLSGGPLPVFWRLSSRAYPQGIARKWKMFRRRIAPANFLIRVIERHQLSNTKSFVAVSHNLLDWMKEAYPGFDTSSARVIYNKPELDSFRAFSLSERLSTREKWGLPKDNIYIGTAGTNFALKGIGYLVRVLPGLPGNYHLLVAGNRNPGRYKKLAENLGVLDRVHFAGRVEEMPQFYNCCDVFVLASFYDACSNAVLEALSCGVPTLSTESNGSSHFLDVENVLDDPRNIEGMAASIKRLVGRERETELSWPKDVQAGFFHYKNLIDELIEGKSG
ncbi:MAG: glycosyltransferase family 4 protein, partial [Desulfovibrionales bacterium]